MAIPDKRIPDLPAKQVITPGMMLAMYDPESDTTFRVVVQNLGGGATTEEITVNLPADRLPGSFDNGDKLPPYTDLNTFAKKMLRDPGPYVIPSVTLTGFPPATTEVGTTINVALVGVFTQNDGGAFVSGKLFKDGVEFATGISGAFNNLKLSTVPVTFHATATYEAGLATTERSGTPIPAGTVQSPPLSGQGYFKTFYGPAAVVPADGVAARALPAFQYTSENNIFILNTGAEALKFVIVLPPGKALAEVKDIDALNKVITAEYVTENANFTGKDAAGDNIPGCKVLVKTQGVPYTTNHRHQITLINV